MGTFPSPRGTRRAPPIAVVVIAGKSSSIEHTFGYLEPYLQRTAVSRKRTPPTRKIDLIMLESPYV